MNQNLQLCDQKVMRVEEQRPFYCSLCVRVPVVMYLRHLICSIITSSTPIDTDLSPQ